MGCDIHLFAEVKENKKYWQIIKPNFPCTWCNGTGESKITNRKTKEETRKVCYGCKGSNIASYWYDGRNYDLFGMLANVRNGRGFAGVYTGEGFKPVTDPKGLPEDTNYNIKDKSDMWGLDGHSHSYLTVKELKEYFSKEQFTTKSGVMSVETYKEWKKREKDDSNAKPKEWCGAIWGKNIVTVSEEELPNNPNATHVRGDWPTSYKEAAGSFLTATLPALQEWADKYGEDNVRIVFWFDN